MSSETLYLSSNLKQYLHQKGMREHPVLTQLRLVTQDHPHGGMQISPEQGQLMIMLAKMIQARRAIEIGVFTGYSTLSVAMALPEDGEIIACDVSTEYTNIAKPYWEKTGVTHKIKLHIAPASKTLDSLINVGQNNQFDMAFIDADKTSYDTYYEQCLQLVRSGGLILIDNVLWGGRVIDNVDDENTLAIKQLNDKIHVDQRVDMMLLPIGDGLTIVMKK